MAKLKWTPTGNGGFTAKRKRLYCVVERSDESGSWCCRIFDNNDEAVVISSPFETAEAAMAFCDEITKPFKKPRDFGWNAEPWPATARGGRQVWSLGPHNPYGGSNPYALEPPVPTVKIDTTK